MSPTEFEMGTLAARLDSAVHAARNARMILDAAVDDGHELKAEVAKLRTVLRTTLAVITVISAVIAWLVEMAMRIKP